MKLHNWPMFIVWAEGSCLPQDPCRLWPAEEVTLPVSLRALTFLPLILGSFPGFPARVPSTVLCKVRMPSPGLTGHHQQKSEEWPIAILVPCEMPSSSLPTSIIGSPDRNHTPWVLLTHPPSYSCVMANFICQVDWIVRCPDSWLNIISGCGCEGVSGSVAICILSK